LNDWLGRLAGTVVYSRESYLVPAYVVRPGDRLDQIAEQYHVPSRLLAKINGVTDPNNLTPGDKLKVIRGPFSGTVILGRSELILTVQHCYAGRFRITRVGREVAKLGGGYDVNEKLLDPTYHAPDAAVPDTASLKIHHWVGFGDKFGLRAIADPSVAEDPRALDLDGRDAEDVFDILSLNSRIVIRK
jgi:LysM repeat protein